MKFLSGFTLYAGCSRRERTKFLQIAAALYVGTLNKLSPSKNLLSLRPGVGYTFTVHNVGQGLATSLACADKDPFFYFDFGMAYGKNKHTLSMFFELLIDKEAVIVFSHVDKDHWFGYVRNGTALKATWIMPDQKDRNGKLRWKWQFVKLLAAIRGNVGRILINEGNWWPVTTAAVFAGIIWEQYLHQVWLPKRSYIVMGAAIHIAILHKERHTVLQDGISSMIVHAEIFLLTCVFNEYVQESS